MNKRCMGCMEQYDSGLEICPYCGYVEGTGAEEAAPQPTCATRIFHELEFSGLICRKKQGLGKPALITLNYPSNAKLIQPKKGSSILSG